MQNIGTNAIGGVNGGDCGGVDVGGDGDGGDGGVDGGDGGDCSVGSDGGDACALGGSFSKIKMIEKKHKQSGGGK